jgi:hypothetical protein
VCGLSTTLKDRAVGFRFFAYGDHAEDRSSVRDLPNLSMASLSI